MKYTSRLLESRYVGWRMRRQGNSAIVGIVGDAIAGNQVVVRRTGFVGDQDSAGVVLDDVVGHDRMMHGHQVNAFAAVLPFVSLEGGQTGTGKCRCLESSVIAADLV